ncbi:uncharacterized protein Z518_01413 [Rhinocladiella mackenziei CBS 650.93]|uniref:F-box domain-containing protein n=1 Tax=Rhinocladiella mackenziei CBS 650.93 TaxID=1442369 RepID=A0A0D2J3N0_9EURO|nr:uncharacterized protein Z518_01413 [Rhinocladiella mackenziei CBS 650.93]KIX10331.1 hypothetical protein Z518_01413 [Rhinocladiella mackenziei CBS 650.93]
MTSTHPAQRRLGLLDLPPEVRHKIYRYLFCHKPLPITLGSGDRIPQINETWLDVDETEPTFYTEIFRVNKAISCDALQFAYSANSFRLFTDLHSFCRLGATALASIRTLAIFNNCWKPGGHISVIWDTFNQRCPSLEYLIVQPSSHILLQAIPHLKDFFASIPQNEPRPRLVLDIHVWDRHFSFDIPDREHKKALEELHGTWGAAGWRGFADPEEIVMRMPRHVKQIDFVLEMGPGAVQALNEFLHESPNVFFVETDEQLSYSGHQREGRRAHHCYYWEERAVWNDFGPISLAEK